LDLWKALRLFSSSRRGATIQSILIGYNVTKAFKLRFSVGAEAWEV